MRFLRRNSKARCYLCRCWPLNDDIQSDTPLAKKPTRSVEARCAAWNIEVFHFLPLDKSPVPHRACSRWWVAHARILCTRGDRRRRTQNTLQRAKLRILSGSNWWEFARNWNECSWNELCPLFSFCQQGMRFVHPRIRFTERQERLGHVAVLGPEVQ